MTNPSHTPVNHKYGAPMGRFNKIIDQYKGLFTKPCGRVYLQRVQLDKDGYDKGGAYWGHTLDHLYVSWSDNLCVVQYVYAQNRESAKEIIKEAWPNVAFFK